MYQLELHSGKYLPPDRYQTSNNLLLFVILSIKVSVEKFHNLPLASTEISSLTLFDYKPIQSLILLKTIIKVLYYYQKDY